MDIICKKKMADKMSSLNAEIGERTKDVLDLTKSLKELNKSVIEQDEVAERKEQKFTSELQSLQDQIKKVK